jgi:hypothetical protein
MIWNINFWKHDINMNSIQEYRKWSQSAALLSPLCVCSNQWAIVILINIAENVTIGTFL